MALRVLMLRKKIDEKRKELERANARLEELKVREEELEKSIEEAETEEEKAFVENAVNEFETEKAQAEEEAKTLSDEVSALESELAEKEDETREDSEEMETRDLLANKTMQERAQYLENDGTKAWLGEIRSAIKEKRAISNVGLTIPEVLLPLLKENIIEWSKLYGKVNVKQVAGEGRQVVLGTIPEAVWTECCANLNELDLAFNDWTVDCYKVGGYFALCKANVEDSDYDLANEVLSALGQAIGKALDKAIIYGRLNGQNNQNMPQGVVTSLLQTAQPSGYPATARAWEDLHLTHVASLEGIDPDDYFKEIILSSGITRNDYARGEITWVMNDATYKELLAYSLAYNSAGAIVAGFNGTMPILGGDIVVLNFIPDGVIVYGYFDLYLLAERAGRDFATSEHVRFLQDQIVYKGTARYDGAPIIREAFGVIKFGDSYDPTDGVNFPQDTANS